MKGGVGKTTTAVNLSHLAAAAGQRILLWDLDPQAASSFAFRIRPRVAGFGRKSLKSGEALTAAIKETDYPNLDLLPADFAYRKLDRLLARPRQAETCRDRAPRHAPPRLRRRLPGLPRRLFTADRGPLCGGRHGARSRRSRRSSRCEWWRGCSVGRSLRFARPIWRRSSAWSIAGRHSIDAPRVGLQPTSLSCGRSSVRQHRGTDGDQAHAAPVFASRDFATVALPEIWAELQTRLRQRDDARPRPRGRWLLQLRAVESIIARLESAEAQEAGISRPAPAPVDVAETKTISRGHDVSTTKDVHFVHLFDTEARDLQRCGYVLELHERTGSFAVVAARSDDDVGPNEPAGSVEVRIDGWWAMQVLSGAMSPLAVLERRLSPPHSLLLESVRAVVGSGRLQRLDSRSGGHVPRHGAPRPTPSVSLDQTQKAESDSSVPIQTSPAVRRRAIGE